MGAEDRPLYEHPAHIDCGTGCVYDVKRGVWIALEPSCPKHHLAGDALELIRVRMQHPGLLEVAP